MLPLPQQNMSDEFVNRWRKGINENTDIPALSDLSLAYSDMDRKYTRCIIMQIYGLCRVIFCG